MFRGTDVRNADGDVERLRSIIGGGERVLCHGELVAAKVPSPPGSLSALVELLALMGTLVITHVDENTVRLRWDDVYTLSPAENLDLLIAPDEANLRSNVETGPGLVVTDFFSRLGWMSDLVENRKLAIESAPVTTVEWSGPETAPITSSLTPSAELVEGIERWLRDEAGFVDNGFPTNYIKLLSDDVGLCAGVSPQAFKMENRERHHPITVQIGIAHRGLNEFSDWLGSRPHRPWRWTLHERTHFFNPAAQLAWHPDTPLDQVVAEIKPALQAAARLVDPENMRDYLWRDDPVHVGFHRRNRIAYDLLTGWDATSEQELATWKETSASNNLVTLAEATLRKYLETGQTPYYFG